MAQISGSSISFSLCPTRGPVKRRKKAGRGGGEKREALRWLPMDYDVSLKGGQRRSC
jgi:hypothetical protein